MSILDELKKEGVWKRFLLTKTQRNQLTKKEIKELELFVASKRFLTPFVLGVPEKKILSKLGSTKKRTVYVFDEDIQWRLKLLAHLLYVYDDKLASNLYSFRKGVTAKTAFDRIRKIKDVDKCYVLKADIRNYFNSIPVDQLLAVLRDNIDDDPELLDFLELLLKDGRSVYNGELLYEDRGAMAGVPLASFFANFYLKEMDLYFEKRGIDYFRYSDDILIFSRSEEEMRDHYQILNSFLDKKGLLLNEDKLRFISPGAGFEFLGLKYLGGTIDLSDVTISKMKRKIARKARSLYRKRAQKAYSFEKAATLMIRCFDAKLYDLTGDREYTWARFYFPIITSSSGLKKIDEYMLEYLRFLYSGRHYKGNYKVTYEQIKKLGYTSLVHEYYGWLEDNKKLREMNG